MESAEKKPRSRKKGDPPAGTEMPFEAALARLEEIVGRLESGELGLDDSLALFEEGVRLSRLCQGKLTEVERKVEVVLRDSSGEIRTVALAEGAEEDDDDADAGDDDAF